MKRQKFLFSPFLVDTLWHKMGKVERKYEKTEMEKPNLVKVQTHFFGIKIWQKVTTTLQLLLSQFLVEAQ